MQGKILTSIMALSLAAAFPVALALFGGAVAQEAAQPTSAAPPVGTADFVLTNGKVYTVNELQPWAVAVTGNEIVYVGDA